MGRMEILTGVERWRDWSDDEKLSILQEAADPDVKGTLHPKKRSMEKVRSGQRTPFRCSPVRSPRSALSKSNQLRKFIFCATLCFA